MTAFKQRIVITIPFKATKALKRGRKCHVLRNGQWYELVPVNKQGDGRLHRKISKLRAKLKALQLQQKALGAEEHA